MKLKVNKIVRGALFASIAVSFSACTAVPSAQKAPRIDVAMPTQLQQSSSAQEMAQPAMPNMQMQQMEALAKSNSVLQVQNKILADMDSMRERMRRVERAMIRLDRRMKLVEKNELSRMSGIDATGSGMNTSSDMSGGASFRPMSHVEQSPTRTPQHYGVISSPFARGATNSSATGFKTVSHNVNSGLQIGAPNKAGKASVGVKSLAAMPSLADNDEPASLPNGGVQIWTVTYQPNKVWPSREQLAGALDMLDSLKSGKKVTLFARVQRPSSEMFKDRLKAISRYLSEVAEVDNLPIASMPAQHLPSDTIEIIAAQ